MLCVYLPSPKLLDVAEIKEMLPFGGQGSNQAIEDAGALGYLLNGIETAEGVTKNLDLFERIRRKRVSRVQVLSQVRVGKEMDVREELSLYADPPGSGKIPTSRCPKIGNDSVIALPGTHAERLAHDYG